MGATEGSASMAHAFTKRADLPPLRLVEARHIDPERVDNTTDPRAVLNEACETWEELWCPAVNTLGRGHRVGQRPVPQARTTFLYSHQKGVSDVQETNHKGGRVAPHTVLGAVGRSTHGFRPFVRFV